MKTLNINKTPNYYLIIMEDGGRRRPRRGGLGSVGAVCASVRVCAWSRERLCAWCLCEFVDGECMSGYE